MKYVEQQLGPDENIVYTARLHWVVMLTGTIVSALLGFAGVGLLVNRGLLRLLAVALIVLSTAMYTVVFSKRAASEIALTNKRLLLKEGLAEYRFTQTLLSDVEGIVIEQSSAGRRLGFGTIVVHEKTGKRERIDKVENPLEFQRQAELQRDNVTAQ